MKFLPPYESSARSILRRNQPSAGSTADELRESLKAFTLQAGGTIRSSGGRASAGNGGGN